MSFVIYIEFVSDLDQPGTCSFIHLEMTAEVQIRNGKKFCFIFPFNQKKAISPYLLKTDQTIRKQFEFVIDLDLPGPRSFIPLEMAALWS